jgi:hypothetical protein
LAIAEVVLATAMTVTYDNKLPFHDDIIADIVSLVQRIDKARLYRGRGGELFRQASCLLLENIARSHLVMSIRTQVSLVELLNENLKQPHELVQKAASSALRQFLFTYFSSSATDPSDNLQTVTVLKYLEGLKKGDNVAVTRGSALALGVLPYRYIYIYVCIYMYTYLFFDWFLFYVSRTVL